MALIVIGDKPVDGTDRKNREQWGSKREHEIKELIKNPLTT